MTRIAHVLALRALFVLFVLGTAQPARAFDFVVTRYDDPLPDGCLATDCSLREAVIAANAGSDADRILLSAGLYTVDRLGAGEQFAATGDLDIRQPVEIAGVAAGVTRITTGAIAETLFTQPLTGYSVTFRDLSIENADRGAIASGSATLVERCEIRGSGAGGLATGVQVSIARGLTLRDSTIAGGNGNGLQISQGSATVENSTVADNTLQQIGMSEATSFSCTHCTLSGSPPGQIELTVFQSVASFANSVVVGECFVDEVSTWTSLGGNRESPGATCKLDHALDLDGILAANLVLGALADNGGPTRTQLPAANAATIAGSNSANCLTHDQRGMERATQCDSGAVERKSTNPPTPLLLDGFEQGNPGAWIAESG